MKLFSRKKLNSKGFAHLEILIIAIVVVAVAAAGFLVYNHEHKKTSKSKAGSYTYLWSYAGINVNACKTYIPVYGGVYRVTFLYTKGGSTPNTTYEAWVNRYSGKGSILDYQQGSAYWWGVAAALTVNESILLGDQVEAAVNPQSTFHTAPKAVLYPASQVGTWPNC